MSIHTISPFQKLVAAVVLVVLAVTLPAAAATDQKKAFWLKAVSAEERGAAEGSVGSRGGRVIASYPNALLVELPESSVDAVHKATPLIPLPDLHKIGHWRGSFDPLDASSAMAITGRTTSLDAAAGRGLRLIQFVGPPQDSWLSAVDSAGAELVTYFPHASYLARLDDAQAATVRSMPFVRAIVPWSAALKFDPETDRLRNKDLAAVEINLVLFNPTKDPAASLAEKNALLARGFIVGSGHMGNHEVIRAIVPSALFDSLAAMPDVIALEAYHRPQADDESTVLIAGGHHNGQTGVSPPNPTHRGTGEPNDWLTTIGVNGSNITVGVVDDGVTKTESHLQDRVTDILSNTSTGGNGHGHHVASIIAGSCTHGNDLDGYKLGAGAVPAASILNQPFLKSGWSNTCGTTTQFGCLAWQTVTTNGTNGIAGSLQNNSWGSGEPSVNLTYGSMEREYDLRVRDANESTTVNEQLVIFFPSGNWGSAGMNRPKSAKNIITTGAVDSYRPQFNSTVAPPAGSGCPSGAQHFPCTNINMMLCFSSHGLVNDGRIKPDLVSPGADVAGARVNFYNGSGWGAIDNDHAFVSGTSQASPNTAGQAALIMSKWKSTSGVTPSPAMVKAILINSADDIRTSAAASANSVYPLSPSAFGFPNEREGWGRVNTRRHLDPGSVPVHYNDQSPAATFGAALEFRSFHYTVASSSEPLYITLAWTDAAAAINANPQLVNDLDLEVKVNGVTYTGNVLRGATGTGGKVSITGGTRDSRNNVENVFLPSVTAGQTISIHVRATAINGDGVPFNADPTDQDFALVIYNGAACTSPGLPGSVTAIASAPNRVTVSWTGAAGSPQSYRIYRSEPGAGCPVVGYNLVGTVSEPTHTFDDTSVSGGSIYSYFVTAVGTDCESEQSACAIAHVTGACTLPPSFGGLTSVTAPQNASCTLQLAWAAGVSNCAGAITYNIYRSTSPGFAPAPENRIAMDVTGTSYSDPVPGPGVFYYKVRAVDSAVGVEDFNTVEKSAATQGPDIPTVLYSENFDARPAGDMAGFTVTGTGALTDWRGVMACAPNQSPGNIFRFGGASCTSQYMDSFNSNAFINGASGLAFPPGAKNARLDFWHRWDFESCCDGAVMRIRRGDGQTFTVPASAVLAGGYFWSGTNNNTMTNSVIDLDAACNAVFGSTDGCAGKTVFLAFGVYGDSSVVRAGWFIDDVKVTYNSPSACTACTPPGVPTGLTLTNPANNTVRLTWNAGNPAGTTYKIYRESGICPVSAPALIASTTATTYDDTGLAGGSTFRYVVRSVSESGCESGNSSCVTATATGPLLGAPGHVVAAGVSTTSIRVSWAPVQGATRYIVERSADNTTFTPIGEPFGYSLLDIGLDPNRSYIYRVTARDTVNERTSSPSARDVGTTVVFTDDPLVSRTIVKAVHINDLRAAVNSVRTLASLGPGFYTDPVIVPGTTAIKRAHITDLRAALDAAFTALGLAPITYTDPSIVAGSTVIKAVHIQELRNGAR